MRTLTQFRITKASLFSMVIMMTCICSCSHVEYTTQHFSYPPGSKPFENDWKYIGLVIVSSYRSPITENSDKHVRIKISDNNQKSYLEDNLDFVCASIRSKIVWREFEYLEIELAETGNKFAEDSYNAQLVRTGPNVLAKLTYQFDTKYGVFRRIKP